MYTIHFHDEGTGKSSNEGVFSTAKDAWASAYLPGYGHTEVKEISDEEALAIILMDIEDITDEEYQCEFLPYSIEFSDWEFEEVYDKLREKNIRYHIEHKLPGWELLKEYMDKEN